MSCLRQLSTRRYPHLLLSAGVSAALRPQRAAAIDLYVLYPQGAQQQTRRPPLLLSIDGTDGWTDRLIVILIILIVILIVHHPLTLSLLAKSFLFCKSSVPQPFLFLLRDSLYGFPRLFTVTSEHIRLFTF